ncbi:type II secretion system F family protein [Micropruina sp.]|uniref:type II secretion system F family protein n=1 Tax=Micropruina sp. TaxID=2737536 RepID=UPI0039E4CC0E
MNTAALGAGQLVLLAALSAALAVCLIVGPFRCRPQVLSGSGAPASAGRAPGWRAAFAAVDGAPSAIVRAAVAVIAGCFVIGSGAGSALAAPLAGLVGVVVFVALGRYRPGAVRRGELELQAALPTVCTLLAVCLEAGLPLRNAVAALAEGLAGSMGQVLLRLDAAVRLGTPEPDAWRELGRVHPAFETLARELGHAAGNGLALAPLLRQHAREAQRTLHAAAQARARRAGVNSVVPLMVCFLPAFLLTGVVPIVGGAALQLLS